MTELLLIRHALSVSGVQTPGLSEEGVEQALRLGSWLKGEDVDVLVTSPMRRAVETARIVAEQMGRGVDATVDDLREWDTDFVPQLDREAFRARVAGAVDEVFTRWPVDRVAAVCHGGMLNAAIGGVLGVPALFWVNPGYTSVSRLRRVPGGRTVVVSVNETRTCTPAGTDREDALRRYDALASGPVAAASPCSPTPGSAGAP